MVLAQSAGSASTRTTAAASQESGSQTAASASKPAVEVTHDQPLTTMSVQVKVVDVLATVRDKHGKIVNGLTKDDFTLTEDGRPQSIHYFARETDIPLTLGLLVDTSLSQRRVLGEERSASQSFLDYMVRADRDKAFIIHFDREVELLQDLTASHEKLEAALGNLKRRSSTAPAEAAIPGAAVIPEAEVVPGWAPGVITVAARCSMMRSTWLRMN